MTEVADGPVAPSGLNHLVLNVRDIEESEAFWSGLLGFERVGVLRDEMLPPDTKMRFYSGADHHHDIALVQTPGLPEPENWRMFGGACAVNHIAVTYPDQESWKRQVEFLVANGVEVKSRVDHGMTHSIYIADPNGYGVEVLYDLPREVWEHDINGALNYATAPPPDAHITDETEYVREFG